jgi:OmpA-OmpF porin, OOP family
LEKRRSFMFKGIFNILLTVFFLSLPCIGMAVSDPNDQEGSKDPSIFTRMQGFFISQYDELEFDRYEFPVGPDKTEAVEGRHYSVHYYINDGVKQPSGLQVVRNYANAAGAVGGKKVYEFEDGGLQYITLKVVKGNAEIWTLVQAGSNGMYNVEIVEKELMKQDVVADASSLASSINETGRASVYGIYFDTGKADIKPQSAAAISEIAKMLQANPGMKLYVVGHTDNVGTFDSNVKLSNSRADAVVKELVSKHSVAAARLQPFGAGQTSPVASNQTDEGKAKNRRVELVAQ